MKNMSSILFKFSDMDKISQILLFLIVLVFLMLISITVINLITKKKNNKYDMENRNIKRYSDLIKEEDNVEAPVAPAKVVEAKKEMPKLIVKEEKKKTPEIIEKLDEEEIESLEIEEPKEEVIVTKPSSIEEISKLIENTLEQEPIDLTNFEEEQEKDAIISYDELVKRAGAKKIIYRAETKAEEKKAKNIIKSLYEYYTNMLQPSYTQEEIPQIVADYISGMTDQYAIRRYKDLFIPMPLAERTNDDALLKKARERE